MVHPTIDGCIELQQQHRPAPENIRAVRIRVAPLVLDLCNKRAITLGIESRYSVYHSAATGLVRGKSGLQEYTDEAVNDPEIKRVRECVTAVADASITEDQSFIEVELKNGEKISRFVEQSLGNLRRPLTDRQLEDKFRGQAVLTVPDAQVERLIDLCWRIDQLNDVDELVRATLPG